MAKIFPKKIPLDIVDVAKRKGEKILFGNFQEYLPNDVNVYYSKTWRDIRHEKNNKETIYKNGECDFVIVWPQYGILVIECKGGGVSLKDGQFSSIDRYGQISKIRNPYQQINDSRYSIINHLDRKNLLGRSYFELTQTIIDGVFFPQSKREKWVNIGLDKNYQITGFENNLGKNIYDWIKGIFKQTLSERGFRPLSERECNILHKVFEPEGIPEFAFNTELIGPENFFAAGIIPSFFQSKIISQLIYTPRNLIYGAAGTGKTLIGVDALYRFNDPQKDSIYVCNSQILAENLRNKNIDAPKNIKIYSYFEFLRELVSILRFYEISIDDNYDDTQVVDLIVRKTPYNCNTLVIDEMQDLDENVIPALARLTVKNGKFIGLFDPEQNIVNESFSPDDLRDIYDFGNFYVLEDNVRNTPQIISFYQELCPTIRTVNSISPSGPENEIITLEKIDIKKLENCLNKIIKKYSLKSSEIIIIVKDQEEFSKLKFSASKTGNLSSKISFDFSDKNKIRVLCIEEAKGLESKAVLIWSDYKSFNEKEKYISMSRARTLLALVQLSA